ncbi:MAG: universal stress protein [Lutibacter sp.]|nr:universal stress protein [Lutibacter sp.]MDT8416986.1 universal stress protein [Lutibacter sp.]
MKTILYATDYSENAETAIKYAHVLSTKMGATLLVIHIYKLPLILGLELEAFYDELEKTTFEKNQTKLINFCKKHLGQNLDLINVKTYSFEDLSVSHGILSKAREHKVFMIVIGMKKESAIKELFMGDTSMDIIEKAPCPVLAIPKDTNFQNLKTIVYATDFEEEDIGAILKVSQIARKFNSDIKVVHIATKKEPDGKVQMEWFKEMVRQKVTYKKMEFEVLTSDEIFITLRAYLETVDANLVAMLEREKSGFLRNLFHRDLVKEMESFGKIPLLSFNEANY